MIITINENIRIWKEFNPIDLSWDDNLLNSSDSKRNLARLGFNKERIAIKDRWFDVLTPSELVLSGFTCSDIITCKLIFIFFEFIYKF